jgi:hypothetical protein
MRVHLRAGSPQRTRSSLGVSDTGLLTASFLIQEPGDPRTMVGPWFPGRIARADHRVTIAEWPVADLVAWPRIVQAVGAPVMRLFYPSSDFSPEWVAQQEPGFR